MKITKVLTIFFIILFSFYSCTNQINNTISEIKSIKPIKTGKVLFGKAIFPASRKEIASFKTKSFNTKSLSVSNFKTKGFKIKSVPSDISSVSTISVIIPSDSATTPNKTIATGITDTLGNFQIDMSTITLVNNTIYVLEASKRTGKDIETIRTFIKWNGTAWESITTGDALINETTTSVSIIAGLTNIPSINLISKIDPANVSDIKDATNTNVLITKADITKVAGLVNSVLLGERDPIALIKYDLTKPYKFFVDQTYNFANITLENGCTGCSFIGANFSTSGANLSGKDLSYSDLSGQDLSTADLSGTILIGADLTGANLPADMSYLNLESVILKNQDFTQKTLTGTNFHNADLTGAIFTSQDLTKTRLSGTNLTNSDLSSANLTKCYLFETVFDNAKVSNTNFEKSDLTGANFSTIQGSNFSGISFKNSILIGSNFSGVNLYGINLKTSNIVGSDFSKSSLSFGYNDIPQDLSNCNFSDATIVGSGNYSYTSSFTNRNFSSVNFENAKLKNAYFHNTDCNNCNFTNTEFDSVTFDTINLESSFFDNIKLKTNMEIKKSNLRKSTFKNISIPDFFITFKINATDFSYSEVNNVKSPLLEINFQKADYTKVIDSEFNKFYQKRASLVDLYRSDNVYDSPFNRYGDINNPDFNKNPNLIAEYTGQNLKVFDLRYYTSTPIETGSTYLVDLLGFFKPVNSFAYNVYSMSGINPIMSAETYNYTNNSLVSSYKSPNSGFRTIPSNEELDKRLTYADVLPLESMKGISIKNGYIRNISGYFLDSTFSFSSPTFNYATFNTSYFKNCTFEKLEPNLYIDIYDSYIMDSKTIAGNPLNKIIASYLKNSDIATKEINFSFLNNSPISKIENSTGVTYYNASYNSTITSHTCKKEWSVSGNSSITTWTHPDNNNPWREIPNLDANGIPFSVTTIYEKSLWITYHFDQCIYPPISNIYRF